VKWESNRTGDWETNPPWYNAKIDWQLAGGVSKSTPTSTLFPIKTNISASNVPLPGQPGKIYFNIQFTGTISLNDIVIT
jgi:hypothetical protein